eukprot:507789_1
MSDGTFQYIERAEKKYRERDIDILGNPITFTTTNHKEIKLRPQLTFVGNLFDIKMLLINVSDARQIKVQFNVECIELNGYYTSIHPRLMDVQNYNSWDITLPEFDIKDHDSICVNMSIILHNFDAFGIEYKDFKETQKVYTQEIAKPRRSYRIADCLSAFYGVTNGVISIFDSISDILFVLLLMFISETDVAEKFLVLSIVNLISVAIVIASFMTYTIQFSANLKKIAYFCVFLLLSPVLAFSQWIFAYTKSRHKNKERWTIDVNVDGILLWFLHELDTNKIFLFEAMFESSFQLIIQFLAIFEFESVEQDMYLFVSIGISLVVILSKLFLLSYNVRRKMMLLNIYCYFMDILFSLLLAWMLASFVIHGIFSITGLYLMAESIIVIPFYCYYVLYLFYGFDKSYLTIPTLVFIWYPIALFSFATFSMYPAITYLHTNPMEIGQKEQFYRSLYEYCNLSNNQREFDTKLIIINYLCAEAYLRRHENFDVSNVMFGKFAQWLLKVGESNLSNISIEEFHQQSKFNNIYLLNILHPEYYSLSSLLNVKIFHSVIRMMFLISALLLDIFHFNTFDHSSVFMKMYEESIVILMVFILVLFVIWCVWIWMESFCSNWNYFCSNMITPKHSYFVLTQTSQQIIYECEQIYMSKQMGANRQVQNVSTFAEYESKIKQHDSMTMICIGHLVLIHGSIMCWIIMTYHHCMQHGYFVLCYEVVMIIIVIVLLILEQIHHKLIKQVCEYNGMIVAVCFASYISSIIILIAQYQDCQYQHWYFSIIILQCIGASCCILMFCKSYVVWLLMIIGVFSVAIFNIAIESYGKLQMSVLLISNIIFILLTLSFLIWIIHRGIVSSRNRNYYRLLMWCICCWLFINFVLLTLWATSIYFVNLAQLLYVYYYNQKLFLTDTGKYLYREKLTLFMLCIFGGVFSSIYTIKSGYITKLCSDSIFVGIQAAQFVIILWILFNISAHFIDNNIWSTVSFDNPNYTIICVWVFTFMIMCYHIGVLYKVYVGYINNRNKTVYTTEKEIRRLQISRKKWNEYLQFTHRSRQQI